VVGSLHVTVYEAILSKKWGQMFIWKLVPYIRLRVGPKTHKTQVCPRRGKYDWNEKFDFDVRLYGDQVSVCDFVTDFSVGDGRDATANGSRSCKWRSDATQGLLPYAHLGRSADYV